MPAAPSARLRVATFNIRNSAADDGADSWALRRDATVNAITQLDADVVGLQEVLPDQLSFLRSAFAGAALVGVGRDDGAGGGEHAAVLVRPGDWTLESHQTRWLSPEPARPGSTGWDAELPRIATIAWLRHGSGLLAGVANTHFDHTGESARTESARLLDRWAAAEPDVRWVIVGDLNAAPGSPPLRVFGDAGWVDALAGWAGGTEHAFTGATDRDRIDHILVRPEWIVDQAWISHERPGGRLPSDHWPVVADLTYVRRTNSAITVPSRSPASSWRK